MKDIRAYRKDPCAWVREILGQTGNYAKQDAVLKSLCDNPRTVIRSPNGVGKSIVMAEAVLWGVSVWNDIQVVTTASTNRQVSMLWDRVNAMYMRSRMPLGGHLTTQNFSNKRRDVNAIGFSTDDPGLFEGWHNKRILVVVDEAKSVPQGIYDAVERVLSAGSWVRLLVASTPGDAMGPFYDCFNRHAHLYQKFHITAEDSPYIRKEWIEERRKAWGEDSALFKSACMGEFSTEQSEYVLIPLGRLQRLLENPPETSGEVLRGGIDLAAGGGDETTFALFIGNTQVLMEAWRESNTMATIDRIVRICMRYEALAKPNSIAHRNINIDADGLGKPIVDRLWELGYMFTPINNGGSPLDKEQFCNFTAEAWANFARLVEQKQVVLKNDDTLISQLASRKRKPRSDGRVQLESKEDSRSRGMPSPDRADAVVMAWAKTDSTNAIASLSDLAGIRGGSFEGLMPELGERAKVTLDTVPR